MPQEIKARPEKTWQQGLAADFDSLAGGQLDKFDYAITTAAAFASTPPPNFEQVDSLGDYVLWKRNGETPRTRVLEEKGDPGAILTCSQLPEGRSGTRGRARGAGGRELPRLEDAGAAARHRAAARSSAGRRRARRRRSCRCRATGCTTLSLQYHSQVPLEVIYDGEVIADLPPSLDGMYLSGAGRGAYWPAGEIERRRRRADRDRPSAPPIPAASPARSARRAASGSATSPPARWPSRAPCALAQACGEYVDHYELERRGAGLMPHFGTPDEAPSPIAGDVEPERADELAQLVFIGGTGRSGTHVLSQLISRHHRYGLVPVEVRFHTDADGFPGLLAGEVTPEQFLKRLRGFWWKGFQTRRFRGMYRFVERERFDAAVERFEADARRRPRGRLPEPLLRPALVSHRGRGRGRPRARRAEHRQHRRRADARSPVSRGEVHPRRPRRPRRLRIAGERRPAASCARAPGSHGHRLVGGAPARDRGRRRRDPARDSLVDGRSRRAGRGCSARAPRCGRCFATWGRR